MKALKTFETAAYLSLNSRKLGSKALDGLRSTSSHYSTIYLALGDILFPAMVLWTLNFPISRLQQRRKSSNLLGETRDELSLLVTSDDRFCTSSFTYDLFVTPGNYLSLCVSTGILNVVVQD